MTDPAKPSWKPIASKEDLRRFIAADLAARGVERLPWFYRFRKPILHFTILLRKTEYYQNTARGPFWRFVAKVYALRLKLLGAKLGFSICPNRIGPGLYIVHWGSIVISSQATIGANARLHSCTQVSRSPVIGDNLYLGPGGQILGDLSIGNDVTVGAGAIVTRDLPDGVTVLGNPARIVKRAEPQELPQDGQG